MYNLDELLSIPDFFLRSDMIMRGFLSGIHTVPYKGFSAEFSQYREYIQGDDFNRIDWKVLLRTDKLYVKESEDETNTDVFIMTDMSRSMGFGRKWEYASTLAFLMAYIARKQGDYAGYAMFSDSVKVLRKPTGNRKMLHELAGALSATVPAGKTDAESSVSSIIHLVRKSTFFIMISDCMDSVENMLDTLRGLIVRGNDVILFHISERAETDKAILTQTRLKDMETGMTVAPQAYEDRVRDIEKHNENIRTGCIENGIDYEHMYTDETFNKSLIRFFSRRRR